MRYSNQNCELAETVDIASKTLAPVIREITAIIRKNRLTYDQFAYVLKQARKQANLAPAKRLQKLPKSLSPEQVESFFAAVRKNGTSEHELFFRLMYYTGARISEARNIKRADVSVTECSLRIVCGKGGKDRIVLFPQHLQLALTLHLAATQKQVFLFESNRKTPLSSRWVQVLAVRYGNLAGIDGMHCHRLRHSVLTHLASDLTDAQLQAISGHQSRSSLEVYTKLSQSTVADDYQRLAREKLPN